MLRTPSLLLFSAFGLSAAVSAQSADGDVLQLRAGGAQVRITEGALGTAAQVSRDGGRTWRKLPTPYRTVHLKFATFDPARGVPEVPASLQAGAGNELHIVHFHTQPLAEYRSAILALGAEIHTFVPEDGYLVRMPQNVADAVARLPFVRWTGPLHPAYKLDAPVRLALLREGDGAAAAEYDVVLVDPAADRHAVMREVEEAGGRVVNPMDTPGNLMLVAELDAAGLLTVAHSNRVSWIDATTPVEADVDNARIQTGADYIETQGGFTGKGVRGLNTEGTLAGHVEFQAPMFRGAPLALPGATVEGHGTNVAGIVWARGASPMFRGLMPDAQMTYSRIGLGGNRAAAIQQATDPNQQYRVMHDTGSWGGGRTTSYTSTSANTDSVYFLHDITHTQSQSNAGTRASRPEAWSKNVLSVGGVHHMNDANPANDRWDGGASRASIGPADDGRIKPELCAYYDQIGTTTSSGGYTNSFGGTSGATPIVAGTVGLAQEMFTDGLFGHELLPGGISARFDNRAGSATIRALLLNTARQYQFSGINHFNSRDKQGWGFPSVEDLYDLREKMLVIAESEILDNGGQRTYVVWVPPGTSQFRSTMVYLDPAANAFASVTRINNLDLRVRNLQTGAVYWGNNQARSQMFTPPSPPGASGNDRDTAENVLIDNPAAGVYVVDVLGTSVVQDTVPGTPGTNADFALVVSGIAGFRDRSGVTLDLQSNATGDIRATVSNVPASGWTEGFTFFTFDNTRTESFGHFFGIEADGITGSIFTAPALAGDLFHFTNGAGGGQYPNATFTVDPGTAAALTGLTVEGIVVLLDGNGDVFAMSNTERLTIQ